MTLACYLARMFAIASAASMLAVMLVYLVVDFVDRSSVYSGPGWVLAVAELYACKALVVGYQLAPAGVALGGAVALSALRRNGEVTAMRALGHGPWSFLLPVAACATLVSAALWAAEDPLVVPADDRAEEITARRFQTFGDWAAYRQGKRWFRGDARRFWHLARPDGDGFGDVTLFELDAGFSLRHRLDAARILPSGDGDWLLEGVVERRFAADGTVTETRMERDRRKFPDDLAHFRVRSGRPSQLRRAELPPQIEVRERLGLPVREFRLALHERHAHPLTPVPAALAGGALALRRRREGHLTTAIAEGVTIVLGLYAATALARTATMSGHIAPFVGGWLPLVLATVFALVAVRFAR